MLNKNRHVIMMVVLILLVVLTVGAVIFAGVKAFERDARAYREKTLVDSSRLAAEQIDADKINGWLENGPDDSYDETYRRLDSVLKNTPYLQYLYVYQIREDGCHVVFDLETTTDELSKYDEKPEVDPGVLGEFQEFDESWMDDVPKLLRGETIGIKESKGIYGWLLTWYEPLFDSEGHCVAYVGADISMNGYNSFVQKYLRQVGFIALIFLSGCILISVGIAAGVRRADKMETLLDQQKRDKELLREIIEAFARTVDLKDTYTQGHSKRVARYTEMLAQELGYDEDTVEKYYNIALMHDMGKIGIPESVLNKPGKLTDEEFALIKSHTTKGYEVLKDISLMPEIAVGAQSHHERPDGKGYPQGLTQDEIPRVAQIIAVADCFDAMYSNRPYRKRMNFNKVVSIIKEVSGTQLTPDVVDAFLRLVKKGKFRDPNDHGGGSMETIENIHG